MANAVFQLIVVCLFVFISWRYSLGTVRSENNDETIYELASMLTSAKINVRVLYKNYISSTCYLFLVSVACSTFHAICQVNDHTYWTKRPSLWISTGFRF